MAQLRYQIAAVKGMVESLGAHLHHVKPHGALYNDMANDEELANSFVQLVKAIDPNLIIFGLAHSQLIECCKNHNMKHVNEGFADRCYQKINQLRSRQLPEAVIHDPKQVLNQIESFRNGKVKLWNNETLAITIDSMPT
jgi:UPF0271 protein